MSIRLYVGNLPKELDRQELETLFAQEAGESTSTKVVIDRKTGKCRGFGFVTVETEAQADQLIEKFNGHVFNDSTLKIEKALPKANNETEGGRTTTNNAPRPSSKGKSKNANTGSQAKAAQPDPRWAGELEKLKEMLVAQTQS
ncbi:MAG: RNA recognition motif domain-containing protein [Thermosynechococcaceae cyanobacterium]